MPAITENNSPHHGSTPTAKSLKPLTPFTPWMWLSLLIDVALIVLFTVLGRRTHESGMDLAGILWTALPFLLSWAAATVATLPHRTWARIWPAGFVVWAVTVIGGLLLRVLFGDTAAPSFQVVTAIVLAVFLLGRRAVTSLVLRRRHRSRT